MRFIGITQIEFFILKKDMNEFSERSFFECGEYIFKFENKMLWLYESTRLIKTCDAAQPMKEFDSFGLHNANNIAFYVLCIRGCVDNPPCIFCPPAIIEQILYMPLNYTNLSKGDIAHKITTYKANRIIYDKHLLYLVWYMMNLKIVKGLIKNLFNIVISFL
jgi:hypothetical protein